MSDHENAVRISGTAEDAPVLRYTPKGTPTTHFMLLNRRTVRPLSGRPWVETLRVCVAAWHEVAVELAGGVRRGTFVTVEGYLASFDPKMASNARARIAVVAQWVEIAAGREPQRRVADATARPPNRPLITTAPPTQLWLEGLST